MYNQEVKKHCRTRLIQHAVKSLTTDRSTSVCVKRDHVRRVWQQLHETEEAQTFFQPHLRKKIEDEIEKWELFHDSQTQAKRASDLRVCFLCGDNPINDLQVFVENGVLCQNVWAIEKESKVLEEAWQNVANSNMKNIRLFKGDLLTCLKDLEGQFDIIYFDACGTLPSAKQKTLKTIGYIFLYNKLTSPGALITNFSFPPEAKDVANDSHVSERSSFEHIAKGYLQYRLWNTLKFYDLCPDPEELRALEIDSRSIEENYGDYITFQVIDSAYLYIPAYRMLSSERQSLWDQLFVKKKDFLNDIKEVDWGEECPLLKGHQVSDIISSRNLYFLSTIIDCENGKCKHCPCNQSNDQPCNKCKACLCKVWVNEILPNWNTNSELQKEKLSCLILTHLLSYDSTFIEVFGNEVVKERCQEGYKTSPKFSFCDLPTSDGLNITMGLLYGQMAYPSFLVIDKSLRLKYTAKHRQMFSDVFIFDKCRYLYETFPSVHFSEFAMNDVELQMVFRMVADGLRKHIAYVYYSDMFKWCNVASVHEMTTGGTDFYATSHFYIPDREVLGFAYFKENGNRLVKEGKFKAAIKCYNVCQELCPENATIYNNKAFCALKMNIPEEVLANCEKALELEPNNVKALYRQAMAWKALKEFEKAVKNLEKLLSIEKNSDAERELENIMRRFGDKNKK